MRSVLLQYGLTPGGLAPTAAQRKYARHLVRSWNGIEKNLYRIKFLNDSIVTIRAGMNKMLFGHDVLMIGKGDDLVFIKPNDTKEIAAIVRKGPHYTGFR